VKTFCRIYSGICALLLFIVAMLELLDKGEITIKAHPVATQMSAVNVLWLMTWLIATMVAAAPEMDDL